MKLFAYEKYKALSEKNGPTGITRGLGNIIGIAELAGGLGIVLPMETNIAPSLSPWAAVGLSTITLLAIGFHLRRHESSVAPVILDSWRQCLWCLGVFLTGREQGARRCRHGFCPDHGVTGNCISQSVTRG
jgi:DoxX-like family